MAYRVTAKGRVTIPKHIVDRLGIAPGGSVEFGIDASGVVVVCNAERLTKGTFTPSLFAALRGTRKTGKNTDDIMNWLRGYNEDANDPGFRNRRR